MGLGAVLAANLIFALFSLLMAAQNPAPLEKEVRRGFVSSDLLPVDWHDKDSRRGANSYNECLILQMAINDAGGVAKKALLPRIYVLDGQYHGGCETLRRIAFGQADYASLYPDVYARYWHGYVPLGSALTRGLGISGMRILLKASVYGALALLLVLSVRVGGGVALLGSMIAVTGGLVWALPYYGQNISYAPGDACLILGLALLIAARNRVVAPAHLAAFGALYGAVLVYFDYLTGQLPTGAGLLFATSYMLGRHGGHPARSGWSFGIAGLAGMITGAALTVLLKQAIVFGLSGAGEIRKFTDNLVYYTGASAGPESGFGLYAHAFHILAQHSYILTHNNPTKGNLLLLASAATWIAALLLAMRKRDLGDLAAFTFAALAVPAWVILMPRHTIQEAAFMVRMLIVPIALGLALCLRLMLAPRR